MISTPPESGKVRKQDVLYVFKLEAKGRYQCYQCEMWIPSKDRCTIHGANDVIKDIGSCGYFVIGKPMEDGKPTGGVTKIESGYLENAEGFGCHRCEEFNGKDRCAKVAGYINPMGCCAAWESKDDET